MRLTKANIARVVFPVGKTEHLVYDDDLSGFGLRMHPSGRSTWFIQFRLGQKQRRVSLGSLSTTHPEEARHLARDALAKVQLGRDPQAERTEHKARVSHTIGALAERYLDQHASNRLRLSSLQDVQHHLRTHWKPIASLSVSSLKRADVSARLASIAKENGPFASNRARAALSAMFSWAVGEGLMETNPVVGTNKATAEVSRDRVLTDWELSLVWRLAGSGDFGTIVRLLVITAARREEVAAMRWEELHGVTWLIPSHRTKNGRPHELSLPPIVVQLLEGRARQEGRELVFGSRTGPFSGWSKAKAALDADMLSALRDLNGPHAELRTWRVHDLRRTAATGMISLGVQPHVVEATLNHVSGHKAGVAGVYNRASYVSEKKAALERWAAHVAGLAGGVA